jgi:hypothetical protein
MDVMFQNGERGFYFLALHGLLQILQDVLGCLLNEDVVLSLPGIVDIVVAIESPHLAVGRKAMSPHHPPTLPDGFSGHPGSLRLQHR